MKKIVLKKVAIPDNPQYKTPTWEEFRNGYDTLPLDYEIEGTLLFPIELGKSMQVLRTKKNGKKSDGFLTTSTVVDIANLNGEKLIKTQNSIYLLKFAGT